MLTRRDALQHLLRLGLLTPDDGVTQNITATEYVGRNHLVRVERPGGSSMAAGHGVISRPVST